MGRYFFFRKFGLLFVLFAANLWALGGCRTREGENQQSIDNLAEPGDRTCRAFFDAAINQCQIKVWHKSCTSFTLGKDEAGDCVCSCIEAAATTAPSATAE